MKGKKFTAAVSVLLAIIYIAAGALLFSSVKTYVEANYLTYYINIIYTLYNEDYTAYSKEEFITNLESNLQTDYAYYFALVDENNEIAAESGSYIRFDDLYDVDRTVLIDKYLTDDLKAAINDFIVKTDNNCHITEMKYKIEDNEVIPVAFTMKEIRVNPRSEEFVLTDDTDYRTVNFESTMRYCSYQFIDLDSNDRLHKNYENLKNYIEPVTEENSFNYIKYAELIEIQLSDGKIYTAYISTEFNPATAAFTSYQFKTLIIQETLLFAAVYAVIILLFIKQRKENERLEKAKYMFSCAAAHELKTPLSVIENQCECVIENIAPEKNTEYINSIYSEALRMNKLVNSLLQYNKIAAASKIEKKQCSLAEIIGNEINKYRSVLNDKNINLEVDTASSSEISCNYELISLVVDNFISNAVKHTESDKKIIIKTENIKDETRLSVFNEGKRIESDYENDLWDIFYKNDKSRKREGNSTGLGLAICKEILNQHKYKFGYKNKENGVEFYFIAK